MLLKSFYTVAYQFLLNRIFLCVSGTVGHLLFLFESF